MRRPIKVVFLTFYFEAWDALAEVHRLMAGDGRFDVSVVAVARKLTGDAGYGGVAEVSAFFNGLGVRHLVNADLAELAPDYIFVNYPWQRNYAPQYRPDVLAGIGRVVYVPYYSLPLVQEPVDGVNPASGFEPVAAHLYTQRMHQIASLVFVQDKFVRDAYAELERGAEHVHFVGSTKLDALVEEAEQFAISGGLAVRPIKTLVWAPHHSYSSHWLNFGNFAESRGAMLEWAREHSDVNVILRPHPFMLGTLLDRSVMSANELDEWLATWNALSNTSIDSESSTAALFSTADYLLTDGISYLAEWPLSVGRPAIFLEHEGHWPFTELGQICADAAVKIRSVAELNGALIAAALPMGAELDRLRAVAMPFAGESTEKIVEVVVQNSTSGVGGALPALVDVHAGTEVAWELAPGREPLDK